MKCPSCGTIQYFTSKCCSCGCDFKAGQKPDADSHVPFKPKPMSRAEKAKQRDTLMALVLASVITWAITKFWLVPMFKAFKWEFTWWMYAILFLLILGVAASGFTKVRAESNIAYDNTVVKTDDRTEFCSQCGREIKASARFCPNCGTKTK